MNDGLGKAAERKIREWLDRPEEGYCFDRLPDQMTGFYGSKNICDFILYKYPCMYYIESKSTWNDRWDISSLSDNQRVKMFEKSKIDGVHSIVIVLFASYQRAFSFRVEDICAALEFGIKSVNIKKIDKWSIPFKELTTVPSRKKLLDYCGEIENIV